MMGAMSHRADEYPDLPFDKIEGSSYVLDLAAIRRNMRILERIQQESGCEILLALKGFSTVAAFDTMRPFLAGCCASGLWEAKLGREHFGKQVHTYSPAYTDRTFGEIAELSDHITFNSVSQWRHFQERCNADDSIKTGLRINPECSTGEVAIYDPCAPFSRLGIRAKEIAEAGPSFLEGITGFHCHTLCQQYSGPLEKTLRAVEENYGDWLGDLEWFNFGGGHNLTHSDYDLEHLISLVKAFSEKWGVHVYLEPGESQVYQTGFLVSTVLDIVHNEMDIAILDVSATSHMPDVLEMPYRAPLKDSGLPNEKNYTYRLGTPSCLAGDIIGDYSFDQPLKIGDRLVFEDQAQYTMVKTTFFNGVQHPSISVWDSETGHFEVAKTFTFEDFLNHLK